MKKTIFLTLTLQLILAEQSKCKGIVIDVFYLNPIAKIYEWNCANSTGIINIDKEPLIVSLNESEKMKYS